jgi:3-deoxy-D-manno-octulosonate 8-phosphate phosphatase (KDO 8-P phosphatase)
MDIDYKKIELLVLDVDGVLTNGLLTFTSGGEELKTFHVRDGTGLRYWKRMGHKFALISGRRSACTGHWSAEYQPDAIHRSAKDKLPAYEQTLAALGFSDEQTAVVGDDLPDIPLMRRCALAVAVNDAVAEVKKAAHIVSPFNGGAGAVRWLVETILAKTGQWDKVMERYAPRGENK